MSERLELKNKLLVAIKDMILSNPDVPVPDVVGNRVLESCGWASEETKSTPEEVDDFVHALQTWLEKSVEAPVKPQNSNGDENATCDIQDDLDRFVNVETEFVNAMTEFVDVVEELIQRKEPSFDHFKNKCKAQEMSMNVLIMKLEFLKCQLLLKMYGEGNAMNAHLKLQEHLKNELESLKKSLNETVTLNSQYDTIRTDKNFIELCGVYRELRKKQTRTKLMTQI